MMCRKLIITLITDREADNIEEDNEELIDSALADADDRNFREEKVE